MVVVDVTILTDVDVTGCIDIMVEVTVARTTFNPELVVVEVLDDISVVTDVKGNCSVVVVRIVVTGVDGGVVITIFPKPVASPI